MKKFIINILLISVVFTFIIPQISFAAWWNPTTWFNPNNTAISNETIWWKPITWKIFKQKPEIEVQSQQIATSTSLDIPNQQKSVILKDSNQKLNVEKPQAEITSTKPNIVLNEKVNKENYDNEILQLIAQVRQDKSVFSQAIKDTSDFVSIVKNTMNKYHNDSIIQQSGQELLNENNNLLSISKTLVDIKIDQENKLLSYLGLNILPPTDQFASLTNQYKNYYEQYKSSNSKIDSLMKIFVDDEKTVLENKLSKEKQELEELKQLISQEITNRQKTLSDLEIQIESYQKQYDDACVGVPMSFCAGTRSNIASKLNPLIDQYNSLLGNFTGKIYSPVKQTYLKFEADQSGGGKLYDPNGSLYYNFDCDSYGNCSIYGQ